MLFGSEFFITLKMMCFDISFILPKLNYINLGYEQDDIRGTMLLSLYYAAYWFYKPLAQTLTS